LYVIALTVGCAASESRHETAGSENSGAARSDRHSRQARFEISRQSWLTITGKSSLISWRVRSSEIFGSLEADPGFPGGKGEVRAAHMEVWLPVRSLKTFGPDGKRLDDRVDEMMYKVLQAETYSNVVYRLGELVRAEPGSHGPPYAFDSKGELCLGGVTNIVRMPVQVEPIEGGRLKIVGNTQMKISAFRIEPPIPSGMDIVPSKSEDKAMVSFEWLLQPTNPGHADSR
jgi:hypothetical protein